VSAVIALRQIEDAHPIAGLSVGLFLSASTIIKTTSDMMIKLRIQENAHAFAVALGKLLQDCVCGRVLIEHHDKNHHNSRRPE